MSENADRLGPVDYLVVEFPRGELKGGGFSQLLALVDSGQILVLDLEFIEKSATGEVTPIDAGELGEVDGLDLSVFGGAASQLIDEDDLADAGSLIAPGSIAAIVLYEVRTLLPIIASWEAAGATLVAYGPIELRDLDAALDAAEKKGK